MLGPTNISEHKGKQGSGGPHDGLEPRNMKVLRTTSMSHQQGIVHPTKIYANFTLTFTCQILHRQARL
eukprot:scaffold26318_cov52-Cyclotella_meneghiniana.AAC.1